MKVLITGHPYPGGKRGARFDFIELADQSPKTPRSREMLLKRIAKDDDIRAKTLNLLNLVRDIALNRDSDVESCEIKKISGDRKLRIVVKIDGSAPEITDLQLKRKPEKLLITVSHRLSPGTTPKNLNISFIDGQGKISTRPHLGLFTRDAKVAFSIADCFEKYFDDRTWKLLLRPHQRVSQSAINFAKARLARRKANS